MSSKRNTKTTDKDNVLSSMELIARFKERYNALPAIPTRDEWKKVCVNTMADIEGWPKDE